MKICLVHYSSAPGGIEVLIPEIVKLLPEDRFSVFVIRPPLPGDNNVYAHSDLDVTYGSADNLLAAFRLFGFALRNRRSVFHGFNTGPFYFLILRLAGVKKAVYSVRGTIHYKNSLQKMLREVVWNIASSGNYRFIANSEYSRDVFTTYIPRVKALTEVIYNPVSSSRIHVARERKVSNGLNVIYAGRLTEGKNLFRWIDIAVSIHSKHKDTVFNLYGDGPLKERLFEYVRIKGSENYINFRGYVRDITDAYAQADVMLFISEYESFGNVVVESIISGLPVIASDIPSMREIFINYPDFLVHSDNRMETEIINKIERLEELKKEVPKAAGEFITRFSAEQHIRRLRRVYQESGAKNTF
jgi:glycosyltransferase involved in cell wall biosynthesis